MASSRDSFVVAVVLVATLVAVAFGASSSPLNVLNQFSAFTCGNFASGQADNQGRLAAGGNITLADYEVGTNLNVVCTQPALAAGQAVSLFNTQVDGLIVYGTTISTSSSNSKCTNSPVRSATYYPYASWCSQLQSESQSIGATSATAPTVLSGSDLVLTGKSVGNNFFTVTAAQFASSRTIHIEVPLNAWATINVQGTSPTFANLNIQLASTTVLEKVLFNFYQARTLYINAISVSGSILAPGATVQFDNGNIDGSIAAASFNGTGEIHLHPYIPPSCTCPVCPPQYTLPTWNIFAHTSVNQSDTDDEGQFAAGGNVYLHDYAIGSNLTNSFGQRTDMLVGGNLTFSVGQIYFGNAVVGGVASVSNVGVPNGAIFQRATIPINFDTVFQQLFKFSRSLSQLPPTGSPSVSGNVLSVSGSNPDLNVFYVPATAAFNSISVSAPAGSWVVINYPSTSGKIANGQVNLSGVSPNQVIHNFPAATTLTIDAISVNGGVLAPQAATSFTNGNINGNLWVYSLAGNGETHNFPPPPFTPPCPPCNC